MRIKFYGGPLDGGVQHYNDASQLQPVEIQAKPVRDEDGDLLAVAYYKLESADNHEWRYTYLRSEAPPQQ